MQIIIQLKMKKDIYILSKDISPPSNQFLLKIKKKGQVIDFQNLPHFS